MLGLIFLLLGLLLYVYYQRPDIMQAAGPGYAIDDSRRVFVEFIMHEMPGGLRGLMMAGLFAAAMSSMDSALNAMASTVIADFYRPLRRRLSRTRAQASGVSPRARGRVITGEQILERGAGRADE